MLLISLDNLSEVQEHYQSETSNRLIRDVAEKIAHCLRETDLAARLGDNEFAVCLPETAAEGAYWVGERIRDAVAKHQIITDDNSLIGTTVSVGVAGARFDEGQSSSELYQIAHGRLFIAQHTGMNQVSVDELVSLH
jgi:diguanylate cyclase (GGDEF)-like protein